MITSFGDKGTADLFNGLNSKKARQFSLIQVTAIRKLDMLNAASELNDLLVPPNNRLEKLKGDLSEYHSIRINDQYRVIFKWAGTGASDVMIVDYH